MFHINPSGISKRPLYVVILGPQASAISNKPICDVFFLIFLLLIYKSMLLNYSCDKSKANCDDNCRRDDVGYRKWSLCICNSEWYDNDMVIVLTVNLTLTILTT